VPNKRRLTTPMPSIPVDVLREILEHVGKADLTTLCRVNKIFCSCSRDVLYREIEFKDKKVVQTLARSTDLSRRVRSIHTPGDCPELGTALRNMSSLRSLNIECITDISILDGCTFKLDTISCYHHNSKSLQQFLNSQPSLTKVILFADYEPFLPFDERCLPNLTKVVAVHSWVNILISGRPVTDVVVLGNSTQKTIDTSLFTLSTCPIHSLSIAYVDIYPTPESHLVSIFPSIANLVLGTCSLNRSVRRRLTVIGVLMKNSTVIDLVRR
jgi:F-box domain